MLINKDFLTVTEAAKVLGITRQGLYQRIKAGTAPAHEMVAGRILVNSEAVMAEVKLNNRRK